MHYVIDQVIVIRNTSSETELNSRVRMLNIFPELESPEGYCLVTHHVATQLSCASKGLVCLLLIQCHKLINRIFICL